MKPKPQVFFLRLVKTWTSLNQSQSVRLLKEGPPLYRVSRKRLQYIQLNISGHRKSTQVLNSSLITDCLYFA